MSNTQTLAARLADDVRSVYAKDPEQGARNIETLIDSRLSSQRPEERMACGSGNDQTFQAARH